MQKAEKCVTIRRQFEKKGGIFTELPSEKYRADRAEWLIFALIGVLTAPFVYLFSLNGFDPHHTGLMYKSALDVAAGKVLFRETFTQYGALTVYIQALFIKIFGARVRSILLATAFFYALDYMLLYRVARRLLGRALALLSVGITVMLAPFYFWTFHPWSSVFALFFMLLSLEFLLCFFESAGKRQLLFTALSGFAATLAFWCRQPVGLVSLLAGALALLFPYIFLQKTHTVKGLFPLFAFLFGGALGFLLLDIPILVTGAWADFWQQSVRGMFSFADSRSGEARFGIFGTVGTLLYNLFVVPFIYDTAPLPTLFAVLPLSALIFTMYVAIRAARDTKRNGTKDNTPARVVIAFGIYAVAAWHQYYPVACFRHFYWGAFLCVPLLLLLLQKLYRALPRAKNKKARLAGYAALFLATALLVANVGTRAVSAGESVGEIVRNKAFSNEQYHHLDGLFLSDEMTQYYTEYFDTVAKLRAKYPDKNIVNTTENAIYAVFGENFHPMFNNAGDFYYADYPEKLDAYIREAEPIVIGADAPEGYILYRAFDGYDGDWFAAYHKMPANIYLPAALLGGAP